MHWLREQQRAMQAAILAEAGDAQPRLAIYRHAYRARLAGALRLNYPVLAQHLGEAFEDVADTYARARPSRHFSIRWHGSGLADTLASAPLGDLARMEWALGIAFDAPEARSLDAATLAATPLDDWARLPLAVHPSVNVLPMAWAIEPLWEAVRAGRGSAQEPVEPHAHMLFTWRKELQAHWRIATLEEGRALLALRAQGTLDQACEALGEDRALAVGGWFAGWVREGMLALAARP